MQLGDVHGSLKLKQSGIITGIEDTGVSVINFFAGAFGKHVDPPPPIVIHEWPFGSQGQQPCKVKAHTCKGFRNFMSKAMKVFSISHPQAL